MRIYLIGFMGSGKSTLGKLLAEKSKMRFYDLDDIIELNTNKYISEIFETDGEEAFRIEEQRALYSTTAMEKVIVACGGGTPTYQNNMDVISRYGLSIYLECTSSTLFSRLVNNRQARPLVAQLSEEELTAFILERMTKRARFYEKANFIINANGTLNESYEQVKACYMM